MLLQAKDRLSYSISSQEETILRIKQVNIKRRQVIQLLTDYYTEILLNPQQQPHGQRASGAGDISKYLKDLLIDPDTNTIPIGFAYSATGDQRHPFFDAFNLIFSLDYFSISDLSKVMPTLAYTYTGTFSREDNIRTKNLATIKNLFSADVLFSQVKESVSVSYKLLYEYFSEYLSDSDVDAFTIEFMKESHKGFSTESKLGHSKWKWIDNKYITTDMRAELANTFQTFKIRDTNGEIIDTELNKMIASLIYYTNHYGSNVRVLEGDSPRRISKCALASSNYEFLEDSYFIGTYSQKFSFRELSQKAKELYYTLNPSGSQLNFAETFSLINSKAMKIPSYLLQEGNQDAMRRYYESYLRMMTSSNTQVIQDLGYIT